LAEPHEKLSRQAKSRKEIQQALDTELRQLSRTTSYTSRIRSIQDISLLLVQSNEEERQRLLKIAQIIPLTADILSLAAACEVPFDLEPQDALVYASVITHIQQGTPKVACFLNRNSKDFDSPDIINELHRLNCRMIPRFDQGYAFIQSRLLP